MVAAGSPAKLSKTPGRIKWVGPCGSSQYVLKKLLGLREEKIQELAKERVIAFWVDFIGRRPLKDFDYERGPIFNWEQVLR